MTQVLNDTGFDGNPASKWSHSGDFDDATGDAVYTHASGTGYMLQGNADMSDKTDLAVGRTVLLLFTHKMTSGTKATDFKLMTSGTMFQRDVEIPITDSTSYVTSGVIAEVGNASGTFKVTGTSSAACTVTFSDMYMYPIEYTEYPMVRVTAQEYAYLKNKYEVAATDIPEYYMIDRTQNQTIMRIYPPSGSTSGMSCLKYLPLRKMKLPDLSTGADTIDVSPDMYRFLTWQLAADLAPEYGRPADERQYLSQQAGEALAIVTGQKE
jgi:hypothetical protein